MTTFKDLQIGAEFHTGKKYGAGILSNTQMWEHYKKLSSTHAEILATPGYGNGRRAGNTERINANRKVFSV